MKNKGKEENRRGEGGREGVSAHEAVGKRGPLQRGEGIGKVERRWASKMLFACTHRDSRRNKEGGMEGEAADPSRVRPCANARKSPLSPHGHLLPLLPSSRTQYCNATPSRDGWKEGRRDEEREVILWTGRDCKRMREGDE